MVSVSPGRAYLLAFTTAAVALFSRVLAHRIVAAKLLNNFAFLIISLTMVYLVAALAYPGVRPQPDPAGVPEPARA